MGRWWSVAGLGLGVVEESDGGTEESERREVVGGVEDSAECEDRGGAGLGGLESEAGVVEVGGAVEAVGHLGGEDALEELLEGDVAEGGHVAQGRGALGDGEEEFVVGECVGDGGFGAHGAKIAGARREARGNRRMTTKRRTRVTEGCKKVVAGSGQWGSASGTTMATASSAEGRWERSMGR